MKYKDVITKTGQKMGLTVSGKGKMQELFARKHNVNFLLSA